MHTSTAEQRRRERVQGLAEQLYRERQHYLLRIARANTANPADAEEAVQFAFLAFIEHFDPDSEAPPLAWVTLTLKRRCWALYRRQHLDRHLGQEAARGSGRPGSSIESIPSSATEPAQLIERVDEARAQLAALAPDERRAVGLIAFGYSYREVESMCGWTYTKINRCAYEGRAALRDSAS